MENSINKYDLLKVVDIVNEIGESKKHHITISYSTGALLFPQPIRVFIHNRYADGTSRNICDDRAIFALGADDIEWLSHWKTIIEREQKEDESN